MSARCSMRETGWRPRQESPLNGLGYNAPTSARAPARGLCRSITIGHLTAFRRLGQAEITMILVTGGAGFIGANFVQLEKLAQPLAKNGYGQYF